MTRIPPPPYVRGHGLLAGRTAVITAAAGAGIGGATARRFLEEGARVLVSDAHTRRLKETEAALAAEFGADAVASQPCDVTDEAQVQALYDTAVRLHGRLDITVNNAGLGGTAELADMTDEQWNRVLDVTLGGTFRCTRAALRHFRDAATGDGTGGATGTGGTGTGGVVVNNASVVGWRAQAGQAHYAAAKAGVMALTRCAAVEAAAYGVRVNAVSPSLAMHPHLAKVTTTELLDELTAREAFGRYAEPWEIANVIVFLAGDYSSYMTGETVSVSSQHP
ncbi:SDR family oxidoreductase [Streptomyces sp. YH02]|uniref:SDR family oxidoreductase n=1 Tax=Streptomyces sp. YH02 TaxID=3256999 RepID=UPI0037583167